MTTCLERFWARVRVGSADECWEWQGEISPNGYGRFYSGGGRSRYAHRFSWELHNATQIADGLDACHSCDNRRCVNPSHVFVGTRRENMLDCTGKKRLAYQYDPGSILHGARHGKSKLTEAMVAETLASSLTNAELATKFGVNKTTISRVRAGKGWGRTIRALADNAARTE